MTSPSRVLAILGLYNETRPVWHTDELNETLGYTRATGYRYVKDLVEAGFLKKVSAGRYALGARIIELDYQLRRSDPVLLASIPVMDRLVRQVRLDSVLTAMFGMHVVDTHRASGDMGLQLGYGRGRPRPLFRGAGPKVLIAHLPRHQLVRLFESHGDEATAAGLGSSWEEFRSYFAKLKKRGFYFSRGELERGVGAAAVALLGNDDDPLAALTLVGRSSDLVAIGADALEAMLTVAAAEIRGVLITTAGKTRRRTR